MQPSSVSKSPLEKVGKYDLLDRIGAGGMAELFKAQLAGDHGFRKFVVIKKILPHLTSDSTFVEMFIDEARITALLEHPNIVQVFEFGSENGDLFIAMQFVDGLDLLTLLRMCKRLSIKIPVELAVYIAHCILDALDYAHHATDADGKPLGIIHRDVSPGNVLISRRGNVKLTDFGIAWAYEKHHKTEAGRLKGKFGYMSPELVGGGSIDARSDLFSSGVLLAEMLMGRHLFTAPNDLDVLLMVRDAQLDRLERYGKDIPASLQAILHRSLARVPGERFATGAEFRDALADWLFDNQARASAQHLARFIDRVRSGDPSLANPPEHQLKSKNIDRSTLSGTFTEERRLSAERKAGIARAVFAGTQPHRNPDSTGVPIEIGDDLSSEVIVEFKSPTSASDPTEQGSFRTTSPIRLLYRLAEKQADGLLLVEGRKGKLKEVYLSGGHPDFVASNVKSEQLGEYLVSKHVISQDELTRAVAALGHFGGRLSDTLIGLGILEPLEAFRLLSLQAGDKLIDACKWRKGHYRWFDGRQNPWKSRHLHLDMYEIIGQGAALLDVEDVVEWAKGIADKRPFGAADSANLDRFGLGETIYKAYDMLDGISTVSKLAGRIPILEARLQFLRILYLFVECHLVDTE